MMTINKIKSELALLKEEIKVKQALAWDCKCLMMQYRDECTRRSFTKYIYGAIGKHFEEPGPIELHYADMSGISWQAREFLKMSDVEKAAAIEKEFPPIQLTKEESEDLRARFMGKIYGMREQMKYDYSISKA